MNLICHLKPLRERAQLSQQALATQVGVTRQALIAIEAGRQVPSTRLALLLAHALGCAVEDLFSLPPSGAIPTTLTGPSDVGGRVLLGSVRGRWVAHPIGLSTHAPADGTVLDAAGLVRPLGDLDLAAKSALVAGCAPLLDLLSAQVGRRFSDARVHWVPASSGRALDLLEAGLVHVAGVHFAGDGANRRAVSQRFGDRRMHLVNLTCWRQGLLLPAGNPLGLRTPQDLRRPGLRFARRSKQAGATKLVRASLGDAPLPGGPMAAGHHDVAELVRLGVADAGVAIESEAVAAGLDFVPLSEERFDLVVPDDLLGTPLVARLLEALTSTAFRTEAALLPGYDLSLVGDAVHPEQA